jgi:hypothetical protein
MKRRKKRAAALKRKRCVYYTFFIVTKRGLASYRDGSVLSFINFLMLFTGGFSTSQKRCLLIISYAEKASERKICG